MDAAGKILHDPGSNTFRLSYDRGPEVFDLFAIAPGEAESDKINSDSMLLYRVQQRRIYREKFLDDYVAEDDDVKAAQAVVDAAEQPSPELVEILKATRRCAYYRGGVALERLEKELSDQELTVEERERRREELKTATKFLQRVQQIALQLSPEDRYNESTPNITILDPETSPTEAQVDSIYDDTDSHDDLLPLFESLVLLLITPRQKPGDSETCPLCIEDPTIVYKYVAPRTSEMKRHLDRKLHTKRAHWLRRHETIVDMCDKNEVLCPYECGKTYFKYVGLESVLI